MEKFDYDSVIPLKREGEFEKCAAIYLNFMNNNLNDECLDANFFDGFSKIKMLQRDYTLAKILLSGAIRQSLLDKIIYIENMSEDSSSLSFPDLLMASVVHAGFKEFDTLSLMVPSHLLQSVMNDSNITREEFAMLLCKDMQDFMFRYFYCRACEYKIDRASEDLAQMQDMILDNKESIEKVLQGTATKTDNEAYENTFNHIIGNIKNKWMVILAMIPEMMALLKRK